MRGNFDHVAADDVDPLEAMQDGLSLARGEATGLGCSGAGGEGRVETVDIEGYIGGPVADDFSAFWRAAMRLLPIRIRCACR